MSTITTRTLSCGMPLVIESMAGVRSVGFNWAIPLGSSTDPADREGLCTVASELVFRGCGKLDSRAQADALDTLGITRACDVGTVHMRLSATLLSSRLLESLPLLVDMIRRPSFSAEAIDPARELALQALAGLADDPHERAVLAVRERHNPAPLNRSGLGTEDGLSALTRDDIVAHWARRARPVGSILAIAGDVDSLGGADVLAGAVDRLLKDWTGAAEEIKPGGAPHKGTYAHVPDSGSSQEQIVLMHDAPPEPDADSILERVVNTVLSGGMASRLFTEVREKRGLCYAVSSSYATDRAYGRVLAYVGTTPERAQESLDVLVSELKRTSAGIEPGEFDRAIVGLKSSLVFSGESTSARASALVNDLHRLGRARSLDELARAYDAVTLARVNGYLAKRSLGATTIVTLGPTPLTPPTP